MNKIEKIKNDFKNIAHLFELIWNLDKKYLLMMPLIILSQALPPFVTIIFPKYIIDEITDQRRLYVAVELALCMGLLFMFTRLFSNIMTAYKDKKIVQIKTKLQIELQKKVTKISYWMLEDPKILDMYQKATGVLNVWQADLNRVLTAVSGVLSAVLTICGLIYILSSLTPLVFLLVLLVIVINVWLNTLAIKRQMKFYQSCAPHVRKMNYMMSELQESEYAKEIRAYNAQEWISNKASGLLHFICKKIATNMNFQAFVQCVGNTMSIIQDGVIYVYIGWLTLKRSISIGDFTMYINAISKFALSLKEIFSDFLILQEAGLYIAELRNFLMLENEMVDNKSENILSSGEKYKIEFKNVWFKYPRNDNYVLKNINLTINWKEVLSIVGDNGAGKTTFIKLLMRLYKPTQGQILLNGVDIWSYDFQDYARKFAVVFQDYKILAFTINENIALEDHFDNDKIDSSLKEGGLYDKVLKLPQKSNTYISRQFEEDGIELSGGEQQKLAICHAIYKNSPILILDEPTANLSPIAEYEIFEKFRDILNNKIGIYISHRMSSCRLSDKIVVFKSGEIIEEGTHSELMEKSGEYARMFHMQAEMYINK